MLVVAQVTVSALILICSVILLRVNLRVSSVDPGMQVRSVVQMPAGEQLREKLGNQLALDPLVESVAVTNKVPFIPPLPRVDITPAGSSERTPAGFLQVSASYFRMFEIPILRGRAFTENEARSDAPLAVISEATARHLFRGDAIGQWFHIYLNREQRPGFYVPSFAGARVIGIARDAVNGRIVDGIDSTCIYFPSTLHTWGRTQLVRVHGNARAAIPRLDAVVDRIGADFDARRKLWRARLPGGAAHARNRHSRRFRRRTRPGSGHRDEAIAALRGHRNRDRRCRRVWFLAAAGIADFGNRALRRAGVRDRHRRGVCGLGRRCLGAFRPGVAY